MCGFAGLLVNRPGERGDLKPELERMGSAIAHRGPDSSGVWVDAQRQLGLAHRRLAILDLSPLGHQPMQSASGRFVTAFNGEIYNFKELRADLERSGYPFQGNSDTEVLVAGIESWGIEETLHRSRGMFAFAVWDQKERTLYLARDRIGEKPLYYGESKGVFVFGSELKALARLKGWAPEIDRGAVTLLLRHNYIPAPWTVYEGVHKLLPGTCVQIKATGSGFRIRESVYWSARDVFVAGMAKPVAGSRQDLANELEGMLKSTIREQMISDVPLGAFLSGGIDSSTIVALMQSVSDRPVKTFTIGFNEEEFDEAHHAGRVAAHLGTEHTELYVTPKQAQDVIPLLPRIYDEPFADSSQIPTFLVSQLARQHVTVSLSGDGGDELFCGYPRYRAGLERWRRLSAVPFQCRSIAAACVLGMPEAIGTYALGPVLGRIKGMPGGLALQKVRFRAASWLRQNVQQIYRDAVSYWNSPDEVVRNATEPSGPLADPATVAGFPADCRQLMYLDLLTYLPDDILTKVDRAAMANSLETRIPLLDRRIVEFAAAVPAEMHRENGAGKALLRRVLAKHVPQELTDRPKMGFAVPIADWLRGPLRDWADGLLDVSRLKTQGILDPVLIREKWTQHTDGVADWSFHLWGPLMFQAWYDCQA